jgi:hypothetical protein
MISNPLSPVKPNSKLCSTRKRAAVRLTSVTILEEEVEALVGAPRYARTPERQDQRNGYDTRDLGTTVGEIEDLPVPRMRKGFRSQLCERYQRQQAIAQRRMASALRNENSRLSMFFVGHPARSAFLALPAPPARRCCTS